MRGHFVIALVALFLSACGQQQEESILPELKGRWAAEHAGKIRSIVASDTGTTARAVPASVQELCQNGYVTFGKQRVRLHIDGGVTTLFNIKEAKRDGSRVILTGNMSRQMPIEMRIELLLRTDGIRFDDIVNAKGRSIRYERFNDKAARNVGVTTIGDAFSVTFDLKTCPV
jgi:hypothetical protein